MLEPVIRVEVAQPFVVQPDLTWLYPNRPPTSTVAFRCDCVFRIKVRKFGDASPAQQKTITILGDCLAITPDEFPDGMVRLYWPVIPIPG